MNIINPDASISYQKKISASIPQRMKVCRQVAHTAHTLNVDPTLAISIAFHETRFQSITSFKGAKGPLGVLPQYHCPKSGKCDYIKAGILALKKFLKINKGRLCKSLAQYNRGLKGQCKYGRPEYLYAQKVIDTRDEVRLFNQEKCFEYPAK